MISAGKFIIMYSQSVYKICRNSRESDCYGEKDFPKFGYWRLQTTLQDLYHTTSGILH